MPLIIGETSGGVLVPILVDANGVMSVSAAVSSLPALPAGDNNIGNVDVLTLPTLPAGDNNIGNVDVVTLPALPTGTNEIGKIQARNYGLVGGSFQKDPIRFGYSGLVAESIADYELSTGDNWLQSTEVPSGEIHIITNVVAAYYGTVTGVTLRIELILSANTYPVFHLTSITTDIWYSTQGWFVLSPGSKAQLYVASATLNDDAYFRMSGFRVDIDQ